MRLIENKCPSCGARVRVDADRAEARCEYCNSGFRVDGRGFPPPGAPRPPPAAGPRSKVPLFAVAGVIVLIAAGVLLAAGSSSQPAPPVAVAAPAVSVSAVEPEKARPSWLPHRQAILVDVTGDGVADPIGWARYYRTPGTPQHLVALDAESGRPLWESDPFSPNDWSAIRVGLFGDRLLVADTTGLLRAVATATGKTLWSVPLGERVRRFCSQSGGGVLLGLEDDRALEVQLATGALAPKGKADRRDDGCTPLQTGEVGQHPDVVVESTFTTFGGRVNLDGIDSRAVLRANGSPLAFALGVKRPGASVPLVVAFTFPKDGPRGEDRAATGVWRQALAGASPGAVIEQAPAVGWFAGGRLYASYATRGAGDRPGEAHLVALDGATGAQVFDVVLPGVKADRVDGLSGDGGRLYVTHADGLDVYDGKTGAPIRHLSD